MIVAANGTDVQIRQSGLKLGVADSGLKTGGSYVLKVQQTEAHSIGLRVSSAEFLFISLECVLHLIFLYIIGYNNI